MKKIILSLAALAALSTAALAERHYDLRDSAEAMGSFTTLNNDIAPAAGTVQFARQQRIVVVLFPRSQIVGDGNAGAPQ